MPHQPSASVVSRLVHASRLLALIAIGLATNGCLFDPFGACLRQLRVRVISLNERIGALEAVYFPTGTDNVSVAAPVASEAVQWSAGTSTLGSASTLPVMATDLPVYDVVAPRPLNWPVLQIEWKKAFTKLLRGTVNLLTGWVEVPKRMYETTERRGAGPGFTWGLARGLGYGFVRTAGGIYEITTFPVPAPPDYQPVMRPVFAFVSEDEEARWKGLQPAIAVHSSDAAAVGGESVEDAEIEHEPEPILRRTAVPARGVLLDQGVGYPLEIQRGVPAGR